MKQKKIEPRDFGTMTESEAMQYAKENDLCIMEITDKKGKGKQYYFRPRERLKQNKSIMEMPLLGLAIAMVITITIIIFLIANEWRGNPNISCDGCFTATVRYPTPTPTNCQIAQYNGCFQTFGGKWNCTSTCVNYTKPIPIPQCGKITVFNGILQVPPNKAFELNKNKQISIGNFCSDGSFPDRIVGCQKPNIPGTTSWLWMNVSERLYNIYDLGVNHEFTRVILHHSQPDSSYCIQLEPNGGFLNAPEYPTIYNRCESGINVSADIIVSYCPTKLALDSYFRNLER